MSTRPLFDQIDTFVLPVRDYKAAAAWYAATLGLDTAFSDPEERLAVLSLANGSSLTLWERKQGDQSAEPAAATPFPIFAAADAAGIREELRKRGVQLSELQEGAGVRFFVFRDLDGNRLEACQVLAEAPVSGGA